MAPVKLFRQWFYRLGEVSLLGPQRAGFLSEDVDPHADGIGTTRAWLSQHAIGIWYHEFSQEKPIEFVIDPLVIEPSMHGSRSIYIIAHCHSDNTIRYFNLNQTVGDISIQPEVFKIPSDFDAIGDLNSVMSTYSNDKIETVKLRFKKRISKAIINTFWHPSLFNSSVAYQEIVTNQVGQSCNY